MRRYALLIISALLLSLKVAAQVPVYDKAKHYQLRSMETGPWKFHPESWYYSWWHKNVDFLWWEWEQKLPGLGIHDNGPAGLGGGDHYVTKYSPNRTKRVLMLAQVRLVKKKSEAVTDKIDKVAKREAVAIADRSVDLVWSDIRPLFEKLNLVFAERMAEYRSSIGRNRGYTGFMLEYQKITDAVSYMRRNYVTNIDRQKAYMQQMHKLEDLIRKVNSCLKTHYSYTKLTETWKNS